MSRFMGTWRTYFSHATDAPVAYAEAAGLMCLSTIAMGRRFIDVGNEIKANMFMLLAGDSSVARKSTSVRYAQKMIAEVDKMRVGPTDYTMEGLFKWMRDQKDEHGKGRETVALFAEEFGADLARRAAYSKTMAEDLCRLYDGQPFEKIRAKAESITIEHPRVNLFGAVAYPLMQQYLSIDDWFTGFLMRFVFVVPTAMRTQFRIQPKNPTHIWHQAVMGLLSIKDEIAAASYGLDLDPQAAQLYTQFLDTIEAQGDQRHIVQTYLARFGTNVLKTALCYQMDIAPSSPIGSVAMRYAINFATMVLWPGFLRAYEVTTEKEFAMLIDALLTRIGQSGGVRKRDLHAAYMRNPRFPAALQALLASGLVQTRIDLDPEGEPTYSLRQ